MIAVDTSVVVAAFATWHEGHRPAAAALARKPRVPAHVLIEEKSATLAFTVRACRIVFGANTAV